MVIKLKGELDSELRSLGLKSGDIIENASKVQPNNCVNFSIHHRSGVICNCGVWPENYDVVSDTDESHDEIIGYILDSQFSWCEKAVLAIHSMDLKDPNLEYWFAKESVIAQTMKKAGVMHWFLPVYETKEEVKS